MDFVAGRLPRASWGARAMQSEWLASAYERWWRPVLFAVTTGFGAPGTADEARRVVELMEASAAMGPWLDLSCGPGTLLRPLAAAPGTRTLVGVDLSLSMLRRAHAAAPGVRLARADAASLPFEDGSFGAVANMAALDLYPDPARVVRECARVLAPGGRWVCSTFVARSRATPSLARRGSIFEAASGVRTPTLAELEGWTRDAGLRRFGHVLFRRYAVAWADSA
ncbi:MAG TPA: class I SAM-dependent methyltransferase [Polyangiaceae bacterium]|nr:class I SAM-dependent methyltransferase [Polyangiaceae bacterium]